MTGATGTAARHSDTAKHARATRVPRAHRPAVQRSHA